jgi:hypothetical protein
MSADCLPCNVPWKDVFYNAVDGCPDCTPDRPCPADQQDHYSHSCWVGQV